MNKVAKFEFIALMAMITASSAYAIDSLLPAMGLIANSLGQADNNSMQLTLSIFILGMGVGTLVWGPLSDRLGRKPILIFGLTIYAISASLAVIANSIDLLLFARFTQGFGSAATRVLAYAIVRDLYKGREMARISSLVMTIFLLVPAIAPFIGQLISNQFGWRSIFVSYVVFAIIAVLWFSARQAETLPKEKRKKLSFSALYSGSKEILSHKTVLICILVMSLGLGQMFGLLASIQPIYDHVFDKADSFPFWFAVGALFAIASPVINARYVIKLGMQHITKRIFFIQICISSCMLMTLKLELFAGVSAFIAFYIWSVSVLFMAGLLFGNLMALALEPVGHLAGLASSLTQGISSIASGVIAIIIGQSFDGTPTPLVIGAILCSALAFILMNQINTNKTTP